MANVARGRPRPPAEHIEPLTGPRTPGTALSQTPPRCVVAILAAHNRREMTLACLRSYFTQEAPGIELRAVVVDDGSSDGTGNAVAAAFPAAEVISASGTVLGAGDGHRRGIRHAVRPGLSAVAERRCLAVTDALRRLLRVAEAFPASGAPGRLGLRS